MQRQGEWQLKMGAAAELPLIPRLTVPEDTSSDITPMIDITFLLLIFFVVATTPDRQSSAQLPEARHGMGVGRRSAVVFTVAQSGQAVAPVYLGDGKVEANRLPESAEELNRAIERYVREGLNGGDPNVLIMADQSVAHRHVARVAAAATRVEGARLHFAIRDLD